ncbi:MAG: DUF2157 domain-containing protein [Cytophagales bacterium]|nr:DUF2157 domain-containing protein [Cytophagales bacterium]
MAKSFLRVLPELIGADIITTEKAEEIKRYFGDKKDRSQSRLIVIFSILGALLIGLGIILIIAHNWDELSRSTKAAFAFLPLVIGQSIGVYVLLKKADSTGWREAAAAFLFCTVGASISLISQIYNIPGNLSTFLLTWMVLCLPTVYLLRSAIASMLIIAGITYYACETSYWARNDRPSWEYWVVVALLIPHYYSLYRKNLKSNFFILLSWLIPLSITICLGTLSDHKEEFMFIAYFSWFGLSCISGDLLFSERKGIIGNAYTTIGSIGTVALLLALSFEWFWNDLSKLEMSVLPSDLMVAALISLATIGLLMWKIKYKTMKSVQFTEIIFLIFIVIFAIGFSSSVIPILAINMLVLILGLRIIWEGARKNHLGMLNYGLLIVTALIVCRFFDADISFIARGVMFVLVGAGFFAGNFLLLKKRRSHEK